MARNCRFAVSVHVCAILALNEGSPATSDWIAKSVNTNPVVVRRILSALNKAGLVKSLRGISGGSVLARASDAVTLLDVARAVDEDDGPSLHHQEPDKNCPVGAYIQPVLTDIIMQADAARDRELAKVTLAEVVGRLLQKGSEALAS
ncbi:MAG TPA: Rrf2 family transcriptional regulator [Candidatus Sulfotelmatobacter sp.]|jgi:Rrf2 family protein|nr:Rrf2 family transcriptional regulator [Candidatus Sulfotelmatobacter sp.]